MVARWVGARQHQRVHLGHAGGHRQPGAIVDAAEPQQRVRLAVVRAEGGEVGPVANDVGNERLEVLARRPLADEHPHALLPTLDRLLERRRLVVRLDARGQVGVQRPAHHAGTVAVHAAAGGGGDPREHLRVARDHAREVHDLRHSAGAVLLDQLAHVTRVEVRARALERRSRDAARRIDPERERQRRGGLRQRHDPGHAQNVGELVRIRGHRGGAMRQHRPHELVDPELGRLEMHVGVDEARA